MHEIFRSLVEKKSAVKTQIAAGVIPLRAKPYLSNASTMAKSIKNASAANEPNQKNARGDSRRPAGAQFLLRRYGRDFKETKAQMRSEGPKEALDHKDKTKPDEQVAHRKDCEAEAGDGAPLFALGRPAAVPLGLLKYWKNSEVGEITSRVSLDFRPSSYACIER